MEDETHDRVMEKLEREQEQWVQSDFEGLEYCSEEDYDQHEGDELP
jgi:hypothetical protein